MYYKIGSSTFGTSQNFTLNGNFKVLPTVIGGLVYNNIDAIGVVYSYRAGSGGGINGTIKYSLSSGLSATTSNWRSYWSTSTGTGYYTIRPDMLIWSDEAITDNRFTQIPSSMVSGKYRLKPVVGDISLSDASVNVNVSITHSNGVYNLSTLVFPRFNNLISTSSNAPIYFNKTTGNTFSSTGFIGGLDGTILSKTDITNDDYIVIKDSTGLTISESVWDFGDVPQEIPTVLLDWLETNGDKIYDNNYYIYSITGDNELTSLLESPPIKKVFLTEVGNSRNIELTDINDNVHTLSWTSETLENKKFLGLATSPNSSRSAVPVGVELEVSWVGNISFYEAYGTYRPPVTTFDINLYQNSAEVNRVDKTDYITGVGTLSGALREECSMLTPSIVYQSSDVPTFNYVYIPIFNRYYYVTSLSSVSKNVWRMELNCDVLMTYKEQIFLMQGVIGRQENDYNPLLVDNELPTQNNPIVEVIDIPSDAFNTQTSDNEHNFLLTVIGA